MSQIITFPTRHAPAAPPSEPAPAPALEHEVLNRFARELETRDPALSGALSSLLAAIDETGEIRALRRAEARAAFQRAARPANGASFRLRNRLSSSWLPTLTAAS